MNQQGHLERRIVKKYLSFVFLAAVLTVGLMSMAGCGNQPGTVQGTVTHAEDGTPVDSAQIDLFGLERVKEVTHMDAFQKGTALQRLVTDKNGTYSVSLEPGMYILEVRVEGFETTSNLVEVKGGRTATVDFGLTPTSP